MTILKFIIQNFVYMLYGNKSCVICGKRAGIYFICNKCKKKYYSKEIIFRDNRCPSCGKILITTKKNCMECRNEIVSPHIDFIFTIFPYRLWNKEIMFIWKSEGVRSLSFYFAKIFNDVLKKYNHTVIVPVPPRPGKIAEKGWDQIDEISKILKFIYKYKVLKILERKNNNQQKKLGKEDRLKTIGNNYSSCSLKKINQELRKNKMCLPEKICLIDDVCTTGATIESCAYVLKKIGIKEVHVITMFKVD